MVPFPCLLDGVSALIIDTKGASRSFERIGFAFRIPGSLLDGAVKSIRNANGLRYQYAAPRISDGKRERLTPGNYFALYLCHPDSGAPLANTKQVLVSLILMDDFSYR